MINKLKRNSTISLIGAIVFMITISFIVLTGCSSKRSTAEEVANIEKSQSSETVKGAKADPPKVVNTEKSQSNKPVTESKSDNTQSSFEKYISLLGLSKEKLISNLNEKPNSTGEGGLEFAKAGIRVWFDEKSNTLVNQIFVMKKDLDLNGVKLGDNISKFKEVFGNTISDKNGDAHFKYKDIFLSINYDTSTGQAYGVYILKNDF